MAESMLKSCWPIRSRPFLRHLQPETTVFTFAIVTRGVLGDGVHLTRVEDWNYG